MAVNNSVPIKSKKEIARQLGVSRQSLYYKLKLPEKDLNLKYEFKLELGHPEAYAYAR